MAVRLIFPDMVGVVQNNGAVGGDEPFFPDAARCSCGSFARRSGHFPLRSTFAWNSLETGDDDQERTLVASMIKLQVADLPAARCKRDTCVLLCQHGKRAG